MASEPAKKKMKVDTQDSQIVDVQDVDALKTNPEFLTTLLHTRASVLPTNTPGIIFIAERTDKVYKVWKAMIEHNFLSVPILQKTEQKYYGFLDLFDIVKFILKSFGKETLEKSANFFDLVEKDEQFQQKTVDDVMEFPLSRRNPFHPVGHTFSLLSVVEMLAKISGLHRVPVVDQDRKLVGLVTQSQLVKFLHQNKDRVGPKITKKVGDLIQTGSVTSVKETDTALSAFELMAEQRISGVVVVNDKGEAVETLSIRDLKTIRGDGRLFTRLYQKVKNFITHLKADHQEQADRPRTLITAREDDTLEYIIDKLCLRRIHRVFVVDHMGKPTGVISLKEVLLELIS